jgi:hypothetical protein
MSQKIMFGIFVVLWISLATLASGSEVLTKEDVLALGKLIETKGDFEDVNNEVIGAAPYGVTSNSEVVRLYAKKVIETGFETTPNWIRDGMTRRITEIEDRSVLNPTLATELKELRDLAERLPEAVEVAIAEEKAEIEGEKSKMNTGFTLGAMGLIILLIYSLVLMKRKHHGAWNLFTRIGAPPSELSLKAAKEVHKKMNNLEELFKIKGVLVGTGLSESQKIQSGHYQSDEIAEAVGNMRKIVHVGGVQIGDNTYESIKSVNADITKDLKDAMKGFRHLEEEELEAVRLNATEVTELNTFAEQHHDFLLKHPQYKKVFERTRQDEVEKKMKIAQIVHLVKKEYQPILSVLRLVKEDDELLDEEKVEMEKDSRITLNNYRRTELRINTSAPINEHVFITGFADRDARDTFKRILRDKNVKSVQALLKFLSFNFAERTYGTSDTLHDSGKRYYVYRGTDFSGLEAHSGSREGIDYENKVKWPDFMKVKEKQEKVVNNLKLEDQIVQRVKGKSEVVTVAERRLVEEEKSGEKARELVKQRIKEEAEEFARVKKGTMSKKAINMYKELLQEKSLKKILERAKATGKAPMEVLKDEVSIRGNTIKPPLPQEEKDVIVRRVYDKLRGYLHTLQGKISSKPILDEMDRLKKIIKNEVLDAHLNLKAFNKRPFSSLRAEMQRVRILVVNTNFPENVKKELIGKYNRDVIDPLIRHYQEQGRAERDEFIRRNKEIMLIK